MILVGPRQTITSLQPMRRHQAISCMPAQLPSPAHHLWHPTISMSTLDIRRKGGCMPRIPRPRLCMCPALSPPLTAPLGKEYSHVCAETATFWLLLSRQWSHWGPTLYKKKKDSPTYSELLSFLYPNLTCWYNFTNNILRVQMVMHRAGFILRRHSEMPNCLHPNLI